jgi:hypothetical protein
MANYIDGFFSRITFTTIFEAANIGDGARDIID